MIYISLISSIVTTFASGAATFTGDYVTAVIMGTASVINLIPVLRVIYESRKEEL